MTPLLRAASMVWMLLAPGLAMAQPPGFDHDHTAWTEVLQRHVEPDGGSATVDYAAVRADRGALDRYLDGLSRVTSPEYDGWTAAQRLAFLINAYNAFTVRLIVDNYPVESIRDLGRWFSSPWKKRFFRLLGERRHLDAIEHDMIRKQFDEPRIHFAVNCAARGCPPLRDEAYVATRLDSQLEDNTRRFLRDPRYNRVLGDASRPIVELSSVMDWYRDDFSRNGGSLRAFVAARLSDDPAVADAIRQRTTRLRFLDYDWSLNDR